MVLDRARMLMDEVNRVTINTIVQWRRGETDGPIACAGIANEDHEW
jgi:hypothetical protein